MSWPVHLARVLPVLSEEDVRHALAPVAPNCTPITDNERRGSEQPRRSSPRKEASEMTVVNLDAKRDAKALVDNAVGAIRAADAAAEGFAAILDSDDLTTCHAIAERSRQTMAVHIARGAPELLR